MENYPFVIPNYLVIIIRILGTAIVIIVVSMTWYIKFRKAPEVRHFLTQLRRNSKTPLPAVDQLHTLNRWAIDTSSPK